MSFQVTENSRILNLLSSESKVKRRESLQIIENDCLENANKAKNSEIICYCSFLIPHLVSCLKDPVESHRERTLTILSKLCDAVEFSDCFFPHFSNILSKRFSEKELCEESEEIRYFSLKLLHQLTLKLNKGEFHAAEICFIIQNALTDNFHSVKIMCCDILKILAVKFPRPFFCSAEPLLKPLLRNITHQQHKVRQATVEAVEIVFQHCDGKFVDYTIAPLTQRLFDSSTHVRQAVIHAVGEWLLNLNDRYSYHAKLIPLILSGHIDELEEIRDDAQGLWYDAGMKYMKENENDLKDKIDFDPGTPSHYPVYQMRPNFGCRELISRTASRILPGLCGDLSDWQEATRRKASSLLPILLLHLETGITVHSQCLVTGLAAGIADALSRTLATNAGGGSIFLILMNPERGLPNLESLTDCRKHHTLATQIPVIPIAPTSEATETLMVLQQLFTAARYTSCFASSKIWWKLTMENCRRCTEVTSPTSLAGNFYLLANLISGSSLDNLLAVDSEASNSCYLLRLAAFLTADEQINCSAFATKSGLLECANAICAALDELVSRRAASLVASAETTDDSPEAGYHNVAMKVIEDSFYLLMAMCASWEPTARTTEFVVAFDDQVGQLLCRLARAQQILATGRVSTSCNKCSSAKAARDKQVEETDRETQEALVIAETKRSGRVLESLYAKQLPILLKRLDENRIASKGWHPRSIGLMVFCHAVLSAGPALISGLEPTCTCCKPVVDSSGAVNCLLPTLELLERGCSLNRPLLVNDKSDDNDHSNHSPLSIAAEAELHLKGLLLLMRLTQHARVRLILTQQRLFRYCLHRLVLPSCVWRAGRTAEAMRKAAATSLVALLAAVVPLSAPSPRLDDKTTPASDAGMQGAEPAPLEAINELEGVLDDWIDCRFESTKGSISRLSSKNGLLSRRIRLVDTPKMGDKQMVNLGLISAASPKLLSLLLARLGGMLTDDVEETRLLACTGLALLFGGIFSGGGEHIEIKREANAPYVPSVFLRSPAWFLPLIKDDEKTTKAEVDIVGYGDKMPGLTSPLPGSLGDQVYKFYPCLVKALDDVSDGVRLRAADVFVTWFWVMAPNLIDRPAPVPLSQTPVTKNVETSGDCLNSVYSAVLKDMTSSIVVHLDDSDASIRAAVARLILRIARVGATVVREQLLIAKERHRSPQLCEDLLESLAWGL